MDIDRLALWTLIGVAFGLLLRVIADRIHARREPLDDLKDKMRDW